MGKTRPTDRKPSVINKIKSGNHSLNPSQFENNDNI